MKIAVLDYSWLKEEHLARLRALGEVTEYRVTPTIELAVERLQGVDVAVADQWETPLTRDFFAQTPDLKYLTLNSTGFDKTDLEAAKEFGVAVSNTPGFSTDAVAEHTLGLALAAARKIVEGDRAMRVAPFQINPADEAHDMFRGRDFRNKTWGVVGLGQIGSRVAELAQGMGMRVLGYNRTPKTTSGVETVSLEKLLAESDVISINAAISDELRGLIGPEQIEKMRDGVILVNTARAGFIDDAVAAEALQKGKLGAFATDFMTEYSLESPLINAPRTVLAPHAAFFTDEALANVARIICDNIEAYAQGKALHLVNPS